MTKIENDASGNGTGMKPGETRRASLLLCLLFLLALLSSCAAGRWVQREIETGRDLKIVLEHRVADDVAMNPEYSHPAVLAAADLAAIFRRLHYRRPRTFKDPLVEPVFYPDQAEELAHAVAAALAAAERWERVRFASYCNRKSFFFNCRCKTEGVVYLKERNLLHIAFWEIDRESDSTEIFDPGMELTKNDPLTVRATRTPLEPASWYEPGIGERSCETMPLWAVVDLAEAKRTGPAEPPGRGPGDPVLEALRRLKQYHDEGLIDDEEYKAKKKVLLEKMDDSE